jgi:hypothetical protein
MQPNAVGPDTALGIALAIEAAQEAGEVIGIRVRMAVQLTDPAGRPIPDTDMTRDVTINLGPHTSVQDAIAAAIAYAEAGNLGRRSHENYPVHVVVAGIARVVEGGFDDPSLPGVT